MKEGFPRLRKKGQRGGVDQSHPGGSCSKGKNVKPEQRISEEQAPKRQRAMQCIFDNPVARGQEETGHRTHDKKIAPPRHARAGERRTRTCKLRCKRPRKHHKIARWPPCRSHTSSAIPLRWWLNDSLAKGGLHLQYRRKNPFRRPRKQRFASPESLRFVSDCSFLAFQQTPTR